MRGTQELKRFLESAVSQSEASSIESWLGDDPDRWKKLDELTDDPKLVAKLRKSLPALLYQHEPEFQQALANASTAAQSESPTVVQHLNVGEPKDDTDNIQLPGYRIIRRIGFGGMGSVYEAEHELMQKRVAIKVMSPRFNQDATAMARFTSEMVVIGKLDHPNLVRGLDARREHGRLFIVMEYLDAENLQQYRSRVDACSTTETCDLIKQAASGLAAAHANGIIHRDIKPLNLMRTREGVVKILDLGLARLSETQASTQLTDDRTVIGTPDYMAPEQIQTPRQTDHRSDIYSLGCTLFFLLTGKNPFDKYNDSIAKLIAHIHESIKLPAETCQAVPKSLADILEKMTHKDPSQRYQSADEVVIALADFSKSTRPKVSSHAPSANLETTAQHRIPSPLQDSAPQAIVRALPKATRDRSKRWRRIGIAAFSTLALAVALAITLSVKTPDGTIELQFADGSSLARINIDKSDTLTIRDPTDQSLITIAIDREKQKLKLQKEGFDVLTTDFELSLQDQTIQVAFIPLGTERTPTERVAVIDQKHQSKPGEAAEADTSRIAIVHSGTWEVKDDLLHQLDHFKAPQLITFGDPSWSHYDFSFEALVPDQDEVHGYAGYFHHRTPDDNLAFGVGVYYNRGHEVRRYINGVWHRFPTMYRQGKIKPDHWHQILIEVRGELARCYLDKRLLFTSNEPLFDSGQCGIGTYHSRATFRNIKVETPDGEPLWIGPPKRIEFAN